ncbi:hypothetical protein CKAH01_10116 [Colletotrichum kahawae]|uniref:Uncharacterized protein n=1 Tax=Colletotrichum kahawae TaxID=34407 RepID=A0AAD9XX40_COLKA|nr:hypothetical protein CKAH01_10116 [Colletotrichum kahawae]
MGEISFFSPERSLFFPRATEMPSQMRPTMAAQQIILAFFLRKAKPNPRGVQCRGGMSAGCNLQRMSAVHATPALVFTPEFWTWAE